MREWEREAWIEGAERDCREQQHVRGLERERMGIVSRAGKGNYDRRQVRTERKYGEKARSVSRAFVTELAIEQRDATEVMSWRELRESLSLILTSATAGNNSDGRINRIGRY